MSAAVFMILFWLGFERFDASRHVKTKWRPVNGMSRFLPIALFAIFAMFAGNSYAQDDPPKVCISQEAANKCVTAAAELIEARKVIADFLRERASSVAEREAAGVLIKGLNDLIAVKDRIDAYKDQAFAMYERVIKMQQGIIEDLEKRLSKPKSAWSRFVDILKTAATLLAGISLGRGL